MTNIRSVRLVYENPTENSHKFWEATLNSDCTLDVRWGRIDTIGSSKTHQFNNASDALIKFNKLVGEKTGKGYQVQEVTSNQPQPKTQPKTPIPEPANSSLAEPEIDARMLNVNWGKLKK